jgi:hypothetical protein
MMAGPVPLATIVHRFQVWNVIKSQRKGVTMERKFIPPHGGYRNLLSWKKAEIIFDATARFCERFLLERDFVSKGGIRERMRKARMDYRRRGWRES